MFLTTKNAIITICLMMLAMASIALPDKPEQGKFLGTNFVEKYPDWFKSSFLDFSDDLDEASDENRHVMVYFHQNGCPYCAKLVKENFHNPKLVKILKENFDVIETNMWGDREVVDWNGDDYSEKEFASKMKVQFTPTVLFLDSKGETILRLNGYQKSENFINILGFLHTNAYKNTSFAKYLDSKRTAESKKGNLAKTDMFNGSDNKMLLRSETNKAKRNLAVFFERPNCDDCENFHQVLKTLPKIVKGFKQMDIVRLNIDSNDDIQVLNNKSTSAKKWFDELRLTYNPSIVFFNESGQEVIRKDGFLKTFHVESVIDYVQSGKYRTQPNFQRFLEHRADVIREGGVTVDLWK